MFNLLVAKSLPLIPKFIVGKVAKRYIAGATLRDAVQCTQQLNSEGAETTIDVLGEFVSSSAQAEHEFLASMEVLDAISSHKLSSYLSVKPTSVGLSIDMDFGYNHVKLIAKKAQQLGIFVRMDMENSPYTTKTLDVYKKLRGEGVDNIGVVLQAYLKRTEQDIRDLLPYKPNIRLCKGIYDESADIAIKDANAIRDNYRRCLYLLFENEIKVGIATHDDILIDMAEEYIRQNNISKDLYEFQMLLGVRENLRKNIIKKEHTMRIYVPFGKDWYGYSIRRLNENPQIAGHILKAMFFKG